MKKILATLSVALLGAAGITAALATTALADPPNEVTFCHIAGLASDPANSVTLTLPPQAVYGNGGHFNENGTTQAGHENDYLGPCQGDTTTTGTTTTDVTTTDVTTTVVTTDVTTTQETTIPSGPGCVETGAGKDGEEGNDSCAPRPTPTNPTSTPVDTTTETGSVVPPTTPTDPEVEPEPTPDPAPTSEEELEEEAAAQAEANEEYELAAGRDPSRVHAQQGDLPYTGFPVWIFMILGLGFMSAGAVLVRR